MINTTSFFSALAAGLPSRPRNHAGETATTHGVLTTYCHRLPTPRSIYHGSASLLARCDSSSVPVLPPEAHRVSSMLQLHLRCPSQKMGKRSVRRGQAGDPPSWGNTHHPTPKRLKVRDRARTQQKQVASPCPWLPNTLGRCPKPRLCMSLSPHRSAGRVP